MQWDDRIIEEISRRKSVIYLGAGVSQNSESETVPGKRPPNWVQFLEAGCSKLHDDAIKDVITGQIAEGDLLTACEILKDELGDAWSRHLDDSFSKPRFKDAPIHKHIFQLDSRFVLTQNVDKIYDVYAQSESRSTVKVSHFYDEDNAKLLRSDGRFVLKVHGTIDQTTSVIFTRTDYAEYRTKNARFVELIKALYLTHTFVFLGCSMNDPDLVLFLENVARSHPTGPNHYIIMPKDEIPDRVAKVHSKNSNLRILTYSPDDNHAELTSSLEELVDLVTEKRTELARSQDW